MVHIHVPSRHMMSTERRINVDATSRRMASHRRCVEGILLNIHEVWPRPFWGGSSHQNKTPVGHSIGHIPFA